MASLKGKKTLFFTTSPRTPEKLIPEIRFLTENYTGAKWNKQTQTGFMERLVQEDFYQGSKQLNTPDLSARDRINRSPKAYGFVDLTPTIKLTAAGKLFLDAKHREEPLLRQLIKFQLPSPYHTVPKGSDTVFWVKPYLELLRLISHFGRLTFDEMMIFGMQLTDYCKFDAVVEKIETFRKGKAVNEGNYRQYLNEICFSEISGIYAEEIADGNLHTRESETKTLREYISKKKRGLRDYTDACFRHLRATGVVTVSQSGHSLSIAPEKVNEVNFLLTNEGRDPVFTQSEEKYKAYLFNPSLPVLYSDDFENLVAEILSIDATVDCSRYSMPDLKDLYYCLIERKKQSAIDEQTKQIKDYKKFDDIIDTFANIRDKDFYYDRPLMFEWNTWRAMTMLDGGSISANLNFDDSGRPLSTAAGNMADIVCNYEDFVLNVEVTLQAGQKQYDNEGEPVARHVGKTKSAMGKPTYCLFVAPTISKATVAHFYTLQNLEVELYGGKATIIPIELATFEKMVIDSKKVSYTPNPHHVKRFIEAVQSAAKTATNEIDWFDRTRDIALDWLEAA